MLWSVDPTNLICNRSGQPSPQQVARIPQESDFENDFNVCKRSFASSKYQQITMSQPTQSRTNLPPLPAELREQILKEALDTPAFYENLRRSWRHINRLGYRETANRIRQHGARKTEISTITVFPSLAADFVSLSAKQRGAIDSWESEMVQRGRSKRTHGIKRLYESWYPQEPKHEVPPGAVDVEQWAHQVLHGEGVKWITRLYDSDEWIRTMVSQPWRNGWWHASWAKDPDEVRWYREPHVWTLDLGIRWSLTVFDLLVFAVLGSLFIALSCCADYLLFNMVLLIPSAYRQLYFVVGIGYFLFLAIARPAQVTGFARRLIAGQLTRQDTPLLAWMIGVEIWWISILGGWDIPKD